MRNYVTLRSTMTFLAPKKPFSIKRWVHAHDHMEICHPFICMGLHVSGTSSFIVLLIPQRQHQYFWCGPWFLHMPTFIWNIDLWNVCYKLLLCVEFWSWTTEKIFLLKEKIAIFQNIGSEISLQLFIVFLFAFKLIFDFQITIEIHIF